MKTIQPSGTPWRATILAVLLLTLLIPANAAIAATPPPAGTYRNTLHGNATSGADRADPVLGLKVSPKLESYSKGNCAHCHEQHASIEGAEPEPVSGAASPFALFQNNYGVGGKNTVCFYCHEEFILGTQPKGYGSHGVYQGRVKYEAGRHNSANNVVWPAAKSPPGPALEDQGNCNNCHNPHGYDDGALIPNMLFAREEVLCTGCHDGSQASNISQDLTDINRHDVAGYANLHAPDETLTEISANKHVECADCHNPHVLGSSSPASSHEKGTNEVATHELDGAYGAIPGSFPSTNWATPSGYTKDYATYEYEVCFKCHSNANTNWSSWGGLGAASWTNVALEFNPNNRSGHPIVTGLNNYPNSPAPKALTSNQLLAPWNINPGNQTMYCSDCHASDSNRAGPHGSAVKWMLAGTNKAWPYTSATSNGGSSGTYFQLINRTTNNGTANGLFCLNCHPSSTPNRVHSTGNHRLYTCVDCHIRVPHGGKVSRLINAATNLADLPARYWPNGNGTTSTNTNRILEYFNKASAPNTYNEDNSCNDRGCYFQHVAPSGESW